MKDAYKYEPTATLEKPQDHVTFIFDKVRAGKKISPIEGQIVMDSLFLQSEHKSGTYKINGWAFPFQHYLPRFLLRHYGGLWTEVFAYHKRNIKANAGLVIGLEEVHEITNYHRQLPRKVKAPVQQRRVLPALPIKNKKATV